MKLGQDENYECQVSPGKGASNSVPLRAPVHINIQGKNLRHCKAVSVQQSSTLVDIFDCNFDSKHWCHLIYVKYNREKC